MKIIIFIIFLILALKSCSSMKEAGQVLRNEKVKNTDEFLVKKKEPLIMPPDLNEVPEPQSIKEKKQKEEEKIKKILKIPQTKNRNQSSSSSTENLIIDKIRK